jgi:uncharacterized protein YfkK (UPF0435 family)
MYFNKLDGNPSYVYKPLHMDKEDFDKWEEENIESMNMTWIKNIYWKLKICSCVLVQRNEKWFQDNIDQLQNIWSIIEKERKDGSFVLRAPTKRIKVDVPIENQFNGCFLNITKNQSSNLIQNTSSISIG